MKKVLYNKYLKVVYMIAVLIAVAVLLINVIGIARWINDRNSYYEEMYGYEMGYKFDDMVYARMGNFISGVIESYKVNNMEGVRTYCLNGDSNFKIIMASDSKIFKSHGEAIVEDIADKLQYVRGFANNEEDWYSWHDTSYSMWMSSDALRILDIPAAYNHDNYWNEYNMEDYLSKEAIEYLATESLEIKVNALYWFLEEISEEISEMVSDEVNLRYGTFEQQIDNQLHMYIICGVVIVICTILLIISCGRNAEGKKELNRFERAYAEVHIGIIFAGIVMGIMAVGMYGEKFDRIPEIYDDYALGGFIAVIIAAVAAIYYEIGVVIKKIINRQLIKDFLLIRMLVKAVKKFSGFISKILLAFKKVYSKSAYVALPEIKKLYIKKILMDIVIVLCVLLFIINAWVTYRLPESAFIVTIITLTLFIMYAILSLKQYKHLRIYNKIAENVDLIYNGKYNQLTELEGVDNKVLNQVSNMSKSFKESVAKQVEAEKMQIELVANVSHDLKTPLTSIISYVDLLAKEELPSAAQDYVRILEDKSARLKAIVADVFDLAKATSGEQVPMEKLDGVVLINQVLSDMSDKIEETGRDLRVKISAESATITGNGQKLYRVFQNVIDNALKYSMPGTRIYLSAEMVENEFVVTLKNISEFEMEFTEQEILSRFTRGDKSRHSEGNGLGLSIAKSFTELCGGEFDIKIDDDMFKVIIKLR